MKKTPQRNKFESTDAKACQSKDRPRQGALNAIRASLRKTFERTYKRDLLKC